jgi:hypothetical protein
MAGSIKMEIKCEEIIYRRRVGLRAGSAFCAGAGAGPFA